MSLISHRPWFRTLRYTSRPVILRSCIFHNLHAYCNTLKIRQGSPRDQDPYYSLVLPLDPQIQNNSLECLTILLPYQVADKEQVIDLSAEGSASFLLSIVPGTFAYW